MKRNIKIIIGLSLFSLISLNIYPMQEEREQNILNELFEKISTYSQKNPNKIEQLKKELQVNDHTIALYLILKKAFNKGDLEKFQNIFNNIEKFKNIIFKNNLDLMLSKLIETSIKTLETNYENFKPNLEELNSEEPNFKKFNFDNLTQASLENQIREFLESINESFKNMTNRMSKFFPEHSKDIDVIKITNQIKIIVLLIIYQIKRTRDQKIKAAKQEILKMETDMQRCLNCVSVLIPILGTSLCVTLISLLYFFL